MHIAKIVTLCIALSSCTTPPKYTLSELSEMTNRNYHSKTKEEIFIAADKLLRAVDRKNTEISMFGEELRAARTRFVLLNRLSYDWRIKVEQNGEITKVSASVISRFDDMEFRNTNGIGVYGLLFDRLDYLLGVRSEWTSCESAQRVIDSKQRMATLDSLCLLSDDSKNPPK